MVQLQKDSFQLHPNHLSDNHSTTNASTEFPLFGLAGTMEPKPSSSVQFASLDDNNAAKMGLSEVLLTPSVEFVASTFSMKNNKIKDVTLQNIELQSQLERQHFAYKATQLKLEKYEEFYEKNKSDLEKKDDVISSLLSKNQQAELSLQNLQMELKCKESINKKVRFSHEFKCVLIYDCIKASRRQ